ncbi:MAG TPA: hypothetical protein DDY77_05555 [Clostridiales bacterium]|nr:hypothetical protein [Clostridiales bacterium]
MHKLKIENGKLKVADTKYYINNNSTLTFNFHLSTFNYKKGFCCKEILAKSLFLFPQKPLRIFATGAKTGFVRASKSSGLYLRRLFYYQTSVFPFLPLKTFSNGKFLCLNAAC